MTYYSYLFAKDALSPVALFNEAMLLMEEMWEKREKSDDLSLYEYTGLSHTEINEEIQNIWLPVFRSEKSFETALLMLSSAYSENVIRDFCEVYLKILRENDANK